MEYLDKSFWIFIIIAAWTLPWKGVALWKAAKENHKKWFIALLVLNTFAILEILYIFVFSKKKQEDKPVFDPNLPLGEDL